MPIKKYVKDLRPGDWIHDMRLPEEPQLSLEEIATLDNPSPHTEYRSIFLLKQRAPFSDYEPVSMGTLHAYKEVEVWTKDEVDDYYESYFEDFLYPNGDGDY